MFYDVVVIGAGPVGSWVAYRLAGMGYSVVVVERKGSLRETVCCTGIVSKECVDSFTIDKSVIFRWVNSAQIFSPSGKSLRLWRKEPQAAIVNRPTLNITLAKRALDRGVKYALDNLVRNIEVGDYEVRIKTIGQRGRSVFKARAAVLASGFNSGLTDDLGLGEVADFAMGAQAEVESIGLEEVNVYCGQEIAPSFFAWTVPTIPGRALVGLLSHYNPGIYLRKFMSRLFSLGQIATVDVEFQYGRVPLKPLTRTYSERLVVVGNAAGQVKPTTGGGIYYGLLCADIAADSLQQALRIDNLSARNLIGYERGWKRKLGRELRTSYWARKFYERLNDKQIDRMFGLAETSGVLEALLKADNLSFDWHRGVVSEVIRRRFLKRLLR